MQPGEQISRRGTNEVVQLVRVAPEVVELALARHVLDVQVPLGADPVILRARIVHRGAAHVRTAGSRRYQHLVVGLVGIDGFERYAGAGGRQPGSIDLPPVLDEVLRSPTVGRGLLPEQRGERATVHEGRGPDAGEIGEGRSQIHVADDLVARRASRYARPAHDERYVDVLLVRGLLARGEAVLAEVVAVVRREDDVGVVQLPVARQRGREIGDGVIDGLEGLEPAPVEGRRAEVSIAGVISGTSRSQLGLSRVSASL